jgi:hypothetical protein
VRVEDRDTDMEQLQEIDRKEDYQTLDAWDNNDEGTAFPK